MTEVVQLASLHSSLIVSDLQDEWKTFWNYLKVQASKQECPTAKLVLQKLASRGGDLADAFSSLSIVSTITPVWLLGTASVERSFSTMDIICNRLGQRMLPENLAHCRRVSAEGPNTWTAEQSEEIIRKWHSHCDDRRIWIWLNCCLYYKMKILPYWLFCVYPLDNYIAVVSRPDYNSKEIFQPVWIVWPGD